MRQRRLRAGQHGPGKGDGLGAAGAQAPFEPEGQVTLGDPGTDLGQQGGQGPVGHGAGRGDPLDLGRLLGRPVGLEPALDRHELDVRGRRRQALPHRVGHEPGLDARPAAPRPSRRARASGPGGRRRPRRCASRGPRVSGLDRVARIGQQDDLVAADEELAGRPGDLLLTVLEGEAGQVPGVLRTDAEVGVDAGLGEPGAKPGQSRRAGGPVGRVPGRRMAASGGDAKSAGSGQESPRRASGARPDAHW